MRDHFSPPLKRERHWGSFHAAWANAIAQVLNHGLLPETFVAEPLVEWGGQVEIDVETQREAVREEGGSIALATYAPPEAAVAIPVDWSAQDVVEIQVQREEGGLRLVAAIELVSPANKDRPANRDAFVSKCLGYLRAGVSVVIVDVVTMRNASLFAQMTSTLGNQSFESALSATSSRALFKKGRAIVESWFEQLVIGQTLPTLPLWVAADLAIPIDLEESYSIACENLRIA